MVKFGNIGHAPFSSQLSVVSFQWVCAILKLTTDD
jgi:hypothetical protein